MQKFDMSAAWADARRLLSAHSALIWTVAGVFLLLPQLVISLAVPPPAQMVPGSNPDMYLAELNQWMRKAAPILFLAAAFTMMGTIAIMRLWLSRSSISVLESLKLALTLVPTLLVAQLLSGIVIGFGLLLLIIPGLYLYTRFIAVGPLAADLVEYNPIKLISGSWALTKGRSWGIFLYLLLVMVAVVIVMLLVTSVLTLVLGLIPGIGATLVMFASGIVTVIVTVVMLAVTTALYRYLVSSSEQSLPHES
ncbi:MAG TPA: hypothetical protein VFG34_10400 [Sphingopyxis sp.]|nr:hypothetical protein [Sphingopyxis sp.]